MGVKNIYKTKKLRCRASFFFRVQLYISSYRTETPCDPFIGKKKLKKRGRDENIHERERRRGKKKSYGRALAVHCGVLRPPTTLSLSLSAHACVE